MWVKLSNNMIASFILPFIFSLYYKTSPMFLHEFLQFLKHFLCNSWSFEDRFVKFGLFDVIFIYFLNTIICIVDVKEKKKKKRKKKERKRKRKNMCVFECFYGYISFMMRLPRIKKDLIFWLDHGVEVQTCTEVVFLKSDEKTKFFKTSLTHHNHEAAYLR